MGDKWPAAPAAWVNTVNAKKEENIAKMAPRLMNNNSPMDYHGALGVLRTIIKERPDAILINEGANTLDLARGVIDMYKPRKRLDVGTWGVMGIGMGYAVGAAVETGKPVLAVEGDSRLRLLRHGDRNRLPLQAAGLRRHLQQRRDLPRHRRQYRRAPTRQPPSSSRARATTRLIEAFGGVGVNATSPDELKRAVNAAMDSGKPTLINAVIDPAAGSESGRIGNLNPQSALKKKIEANPAAFPRCGDPEQRQNWMPA